MFITIGVNLDGYFYLTNIGMMNFIVIIYSVLQLLTDHCYLNLVVCSVRNMPDADVKLKQTVAIGLLLALHFLCVFRLNDLSGLPLICTPLCQE